MTVSEPSTQPRIRVITSNAALSEMIAQAITEHVTPATGVSHPVTGCMFRYRASPLADDLNAAIRFMRPLRLTLRHDPALDVDAALLIGPHDGAPLSRWRLRIRSDDPTFAADITAACESAGFTLASASGSPPFIAQPVLRYGGADANARYLLGWLVGQLGSAPPQQAKAWSSDDKDIFLDLPSPTSLAAPLRQRIPVTVRVDAPAAFAAIEPRLRAAGFTQVTLRHLTPAADSRIRVDPGVLQSLGAHREIADITRALADAGDDLNIDWAHYPLEVLDRTDATEGGVVIDIPLAAMRGGLLRPWNRLHPARYEVTILDDDRIAGAALMRPLIDAGFIVQRRRLPAITEGFVVHCGKKVPEALQETVRTLFDEQIMRLGATEFGLCDIDCEGEQIKIEFPARAWQEGRLRAELINPARYAVKVLAASAAAAKPLVDALKPWGFGKLRCETSSDDGTPEVQFGGAPSELLDRLDTEAKRLFGKITFARKKAWSMTDHDIYIKLPPSITAPTATATPAPAPRLVVPTIRTNLSIRGKLITVTETELRIADIVLPRRGPGPRHPRTVLMSRFAGFCIDQHVAETLYFLAQAVSGGYPAALEGPTAVSKTWSIMFLAALLGDPVYRLNLNAQSDVSELIGRFVPRTDGDGGFRFQYGPAPLAMIEGAWVVIDEANLAPTEILERANPILETPCPSLHLSEYDGREIAEVDPRFRIMATWNDTGYAGRHELSPAFLDRFKIRTCTMPDETVYRALGDCLVHGRQPRVLINNACYEGGAGDALLPELATQIPDCDRFLTALARFQAGIAAMAERGELRTRGRIAITRRAFVDVLKETRDRLRSAGNAQPRRESVVSAVWRALSFCLLERLDPSGERPKAIALLTACGIGADAWELPQ